MSFSCQKKTRALVFVCPLLLIAVVYILSGRSTLANDEGLTQPLFNVGAFPVPEIQVGIDGGTHANGKRTLFVGNAINFGDVSFVHPENIATGDAYLENGHLRLEAIVNFNVVFSGANSVVLELSKLGLSSNPFSKTYHSISTNRSDSPTEIFADPNKNHLTTLTRATNVPLRMIMEISPQQQGNLSDRFRLAASSQ